MKISEENFCLDVVKEKGAEWVIFIVERCFGSFCLFTIMGFWLPQLLRIFFAMWFMFILFIVVVCLI